MWISIFGYFFLFLIIYSFISKNKPFSKIDPPGIWSLPIIGNILDLAGSLPFRDLMNLEKKYGKVYRLWLGSVYTIVVSDPVMTRDMLINNHENFMNRPKSISWENTSQPINDIVTSRDEEWYHCRKLVSNSFTKTRLKTHISLIEKETQSLIQVLKKYSNRNLKLNPKTIIFTFSLNIILTIVMSKKIQYDDLDEVDPDMKNMIPWIYRIFNDSKFIFGLESLPLFKPFIRFYMKYINTDHIKFVDLCKKYCYEHLTSLDPDSPRDLMDTMMLSEGESVDRVALLAVDFLLVGSDTSSSTILWFMVALVNNPEVQDRAIKEIKNAIGVDRDQVLLSDRINTPYMVAIIKEVMRMYPVVPLSLPRESRESIVLQDYYIPKGTKIIFNTYSMGHNVEYWKNPEVFDPTRFINDNHVEYNLPFSIGPRNCVGMNLALDELYTACANIVLNFKLFSSNGKPISEDLVFTATTKPKDFNIIFENR
ncbi:hypothetical protein PPL_11014 [Heterostelium album PN500]|uniref:Cytochrome P450 n=1 Tax=Heterostelium pallidum (strain ATCC 26659 / Pp 5 / PN500) TaxID=670386 RepID=D3BSP5_HETP5|nr:hypothetical protein PPL_11014 [Heterostelium album PN500]EFA75510.1 hypothetical protein PPL_11014 [Heterostelium album PN500]|eukprot:XP_020427644.1 hypothetical protein PPL_11014 [Heterostelium album PN500]